LRQTLADQAEQWWPPIQETDEGEDAEVDTALQAEESRFAPDQGRVEGLIAALDSEDSTLPEAVPSELRVLANELDPYDANLAAELRQIADIEAATPPDEQADQLLWQRMPRFVRFDDSARLLESEYDLNAADTSAGTALGNLIRLAELDVGGLLQAINAGETGTVRDIRERANTTLATRMEAWQQTPRIAVVLENEGALLRIHVQSGNGPTMASVSGAMAYASSLRLWLSLRISRTPSGLSCSSTRSRRIFITTLRPTSSMSSRLKPPQVRSSIRRTLLRASRRTWAWCQGTRIRYA
jgi:hypothetical protein